MHRSGLRPTLLCSAFVSLLLTGCPEQVVVETPTVDQVEDVATCKVAKDPLNPLIVEWPGTSKVALDSTSKHGFVIVSYAGCTLKVLQGCSATGRYGFTGVTPARDTLRIATESDLYARLPLGAASLKGELGTGTALDLEYVAVGERRAEGRPAQLEGDCEGATHYVERMTLGAYALDAIAAGRASAGVDVQGAGIGGSRSEHQRRIRGSGELGKCGAQAPNDESAAITSGCGAILQIGLAPLRSHASKAEPVTVAVGTSTPPPRPPAGSEGGGRDDDGDGIPSASDQCPQMPEDKDGFEDADGCPDPDNDRDAVADVADKCPNEAETLNGFQDDDGCPDRKVAALMTPADQVDLGDGVLFVKGTRFDFTKGKITFEVAKATLKAESLPLIGRIAAYLLGPGAGLRIEIGVHSDSTGSDEANRKLTQDRADELKKVLVKAGLPASRIEAVGYGETRPIASNDTTENRAKNRRVEIVVIGR